MTEDTTATPRVYKRRALRFMVLSAVWIFPSLGAVWILLTPNPGPSPSEGLFDFLAAVRIEQWVAIALLLAHLVFIFLAIRYRRNEVPAGNSG